MSKILIFILLLAGLVVGIYLVGQRTGFFSRADISTAPQEIKISNLSDNSFTVSWITAKPTIGFIQYGESESLGNTANDDRDAKPHLTHHVTLKKLTPNTEYLYKINTGNVVKQTTAPITKDTPPLPDSIFGKILRADKTPETEAIIYSQIGDGTLLSSFVRDNGNFLITLNNARTKDLLNYLNVKDDDQIDLTVTNGENNIQKQVTASGRNSAVSIILENIFPKEEIPSSWSQDFNKDGVINVFDYAIFLQKQVSK